MHIKKQKMNRKCFVDSEILVAASVEKEEYDNGKVCTLYRNKRLSRHRQ